MCQKGDWSTKRVIYEANVSERCLVSRVCQKGGWSIRAGVQISECSTRLVNVRNVVGLQGSYVIMVDGSGGHRYSKSNDYFAAISCC